MPTQISCSISNIAAAKTWLLKCDSVEHTFTRFVTQAPLPAYSQGTAGGNFWLDLGMQLEQITITGLVDVVESLAPGGGTFPSIDDLEGVCRTWWAYIQTATIDPATLPQLTVAGNQVYTVSIKNADFKLVAAEESRWQYNIIFYVGSKVSG